MNSLLTLNNLSIGFKKGDIYLPTVSGISFSINKGETFALVGESGSGKSLTSLAIMQLLPNNAAILAGSEVFLEKDNLLNYSEIAMRKIRGERIAMIFQEPMTSLNPVLTVGEQVAEVLHIHQQIYGASARKHVSELFAAVGLTDPEALLKKYPHQLSGGMKQRVMIAMALAGGPDLLIADEPTSALDVTIQKQILDLLKTLQQKTGMAILLITHDLGVVKQMADTVAVMYAGHLVELAPSPIFFAKPLHPYSQKLFASLPSIEKRHQPLMMIPGNVPALTQNFKGCRFTSRCDFAWQECHTAEPLWIEEEPQHFVRCHLFDDAQSEIKCRSGLPRQSANQKITDFHAVSDKTLKPLVNSESVLELKDFKIYFPIQKGLLKRTVGFVKAVDGVSLALKKGKTLALVGESGCGKTTLAKGILELIPTTAGTIYLGKDKTNLRRYAQIVFQDPFSSMNPRMLVEDIILEGARALKIGTERSRQQKLDELIQQVGLPDDSKSRYPHEFSGGQRQRICIARALAVDPELIICDEPTSALDVSVQAQILNLLKQLQQDKGISYLFITHNIAVVAYLADDVAVMYQGKIVEYGPAEKLLTHPQHPYTQKLLAAVPQI